MLYLPLMGSSNVTRFVAVVALCFVGVFAANRMEKIWKIKDPKPVVIDEILGMWIALLFVPHQPLFFVGAFVVFRLFDIMKPFPARQAEWLPG
jgi:phosphatidylglycerophosphatase A